MFSASAYVFFGSRQLLLNAMSLVVLSISCQAKKDVHQCAEYALCQSFDWPCAAAQFMEGCVGWVFDVCCPVVLTMSRRVPNLLSSCARTLQWLSP